MREKKALEEEIDSLKSMALSIMVDEGLDVVNTSLGNFTIRKIKTWTYPESFLAQKAALKEAESVCRKTGTATFIESPSIAFRAKDNEE
jgi:hypothetical protein